MFNIFNSTVSKIEINQLESPVLTVQFFFDAWYFNTQVA